MTASQLMQSMPTSEEMALARESGRALSAYLQMRSHTQQIEILDEKGETHAVRMPVSTLRLLVSVLSEIGDGNVVR
ncbi:MAG: hypothetical protein M1572_06615 [Gammaproteobacteria bacterium]|nr:hypothetical protein [Gammaproteobacteria bacterium]MCL5796592.1 hypothetical protein [Gammaproteobacteria bacterium]